MAHGGVRLPALLGLLLLISSSVYAAHEVSGRCAVFDEIGIEQGLSAECTHSGHHFFERMFTEDQRVYALIYGVTKDKPEFGCTVRVSDGETLLDSKQFSKRYVTERREKADRGESYFDFYFPKIGKRAFVEATSFGPGGGGLSLTFTTSDGCCDVKVEQSGLLSGQEKSAFDLHKLAKTLSDAYDHKIIGQASKESPCWQRPR